MKKFLKNYSPKKLDPTRDYLFHLFYKNKLPIIGLEVKEARYEVRGAGWKKVSVSNCQIGRMAIRPYKN
ncbi:unnamed protein product [marine sediment metagenome]|uniref:Uncharacterized protein n=1 Tax=marine sediment metagenome TaxID=412755 RepID=X1PAI3_9ZZZZ